MTVTETTNSVICINPLLFLLYIGGGAEWGTEGAVAPHLQTRGRGQTVSNAPHFADLVE